MQSVTVTKSSTIDKYNLHWPPHARGRLLTTLSCGHIVYGIPDTCPICKRPVQKEE